MEKAIIKAKKMECWIGILFLVPPILGVLAFVLQLFDTDTDFSTMKDLSSSWTTKYGYGQGGGGGMSAAPVYLGLMALAGVWLVKDSLQYLFIESKQDEKNMQE